jgi:8-oxo-dGTP pyrophosphatase MutT (NUDIX family)
MSGYLKHNIMNRKKYKQFEYHPISACTNCGNKKHIFKQCPEPVTSWGIILVSCGDLKKPVHDQVIDLMSSGFEEKQQRVLVETNIDRLIVSTAYYNIKFLMISRKHSLGYVEFIRGRYKPEKIDQIIYLFKQMMQNEIDRIKYSLTLSDGFDYLWRDFWGTKHDLQYYSKDYTLSKTNYDMLKMSGVDGPEIDLNYIVSSVRAEYDIEEWGFPKGRKKKMESDKECAVREFKEESGYTNNDFNIISEIEPIAEEFIGTNGIKYRHIYYVAELQNNKMDLNDTTDAQREEVGNIQFMNFTTAFECIRDYHIPRKIILEKIFTYYLDKLIIANRELLKSYLLTNNPIQSDQDSQIVVAKKKKNDIGEKTSAITNV